MCCYKMVYQAPRWSIIAVVAKSDQPPFSTGAGFRNHPLYASDFWLMNVDHYYNDMCLLQVYRGRRHEMPIDCPIDCPIYEG